MDTHGIVQLILPAHIVAGMLALVFGYVALSVTKGATWHRKSGMLFVFAMVTLSLSAALMEALTVLWEHNWSPGPIVQPALTADGDVLVNAITATGGIGTRRLDVKQGSGGWSVEERWTSNGLKPYFNDFVVHKGHAFGQDLEPPGAGP